MEDAHGIPEMNEQSIRMGSIVITNASIFAESVEKWDSEPSAEKKWPNFKTYFTAAQIKYKKARPIDTTAQHVYTNQANILEKVLQ